MSYAIVRGDALDLIQQEQGTFDLVATDPPYSFGGSGAYSVKIETSRQSFYFLVWPLSFALIRSVACLALEGSSLC